MAIRIKARGGESAEQMMRRFKKMYEKEGLTKDIKRKAYYEKPSEKRRRALRKIIKRLQQQLQLQQNPHLANMRRRRSPGRTLARARASKTRHAG